MTARQRDPVVVEQAEPVETAEPVGPALRGWRQIVLIVGLGAGLVYVLALYGFLPGMSQMPLTALFATGAIECLHTQGIASLWTWCMSLGLPIGAPRLTGLPQIYAGWLLTYVPGIDAWTAHQVSNGALVAASFFASYLLLRRWHAPPWIAILATVSFLTATNLLVLNGFAYTFLGYILLPGYVYVALRILDLLDGGRTIRAALICAGLCLLMVFTDGYSFLGAGLVIGLLVCRWALHRVRGHLGRAILGVGIWLVAAAGSAVLYSVWAPENAYSTAAGPEIFALYGVDIISLFVPTPTMLYPSILHLTPPILHLWGSASAFNYSYLGYLMVILALGFLLAGLFRTKSGKANGTGELRAVALAGAIALVLSLGPTLKVWQQEPGLAGAMFELPTAWIHANVPGLSDMRAVNRWLVITRWCLVMLAAGGLTLLWRRWRGTSTVRAVAIVLVALLAAFEIAPNLGKAFHTRELSIERVRYLRDGIVPEADKLVRPGETVLVLPSKNDFLANYLVPMVDARTYNVGGDKNYSLSVSHWPEAVLAARAGYGPASADLLCAVLDHDADAIVLPYMSPYNGPLLHGNDPKAEAERRAVALTLAKDPRFDAEIGTWLTVLRGADPSCSRS